MSSDKLMERFAKNPEDLKQYADAQYKTILAQSKKIGELETANEELMKRLGEMSNQNATLKASESLSAGQFSTDDVETTCVLQLARIKELALHRELTLEESKKFETFSKVLRDHRGKPDPKNKESIETMSSEDLLKLMDSDVEQ